MTTAFAISVRLPARSTSPTTMMIWIGSRLAFTLIVIAFALQPLASRPQLQAQEDRSNKPAVEIDFERDVEPILAANCYSCHGPDEQESGLRLDIRSSLLEGGFSGEPSIVPGNASESYLVDLLRGEDGLQMPPEGELLSDQEMAFIAAWIDAGAAMPIVSDANLHEHSKHWSFQPIKRSPVPVTASSRLGGNPIDAFIQQRLEKEGLQANPEADKATLIRRLYLVVLGTPPTPDEVSSFVADPRYDAYERLVDRVLGDPRFGERWASHWLDIARFGETHGFETNRERPNAYHYRDYVIDAFNDDKPFDRFVHDQIAGDSDGNPFGTGFLVAGPYDLVKSPDKQLSLMQRQDELADMVNTTGTAFVGLTIGCARCHNHKFDPISQKDFYAVQAVFAGVKHSDATVQSLSLDPDQIERLQARLKAAFARLTPYIRSPTSPAIAIRPVAPLSSLQRGLTHLQDVAGVGVHDTSAATTFSTENSLPPTGTTPDEQYVWWNNRPDTDIARYETYAPGTYRIWLSWGSGFSSHSQDASYWIDLDGDLTTRQDQSMIAKVDQQRTAGQQELSGGLPTLPGQRIWSGLFDAGTHSLNAQSCIVLRGGSTGTAVTSDIMLLELVGTDGTDLATRVPTQSLPINPRINTLQIQPIDAKRIRFRVSATQGGAEPCIDELEVWSNGRNVALQKHGGTATTSGTLPGYAIHQLEHINDGAAGNDHSWISNDRGGGWIQIEFAEVSKIDTIVWGRDRGGRFADRLPIEFEIEVSTNADQWKTVASHQSHMALTDYHQQELKFNVEPDSKAANDLQLLTRVHEQLEAASTPTLAYVGLFETPTPTHRLYRGDPMAPREQVAPDTIEYFGELQINANDPEAYRRKAFADWVTAPDNPLTARVLANRIWQYAFGRGLVTTPSDLGMNGVPPTHPQLLDWLAAELIAKQVEGISADEDLPTLDSSWSVKQLLRLVLTSNTFRQSSKPLASNLVKDAGTAMWWRFPPRRMSAETLRDSMLFVSGTLDRQMGGKGFDAFRIDFENVRHYFPKEEYGPSDWRRMVYMTKVRQEKDSVFGAFDCPDGSQVQPSRSRSTTPIQALNLFNSSFTLQRAEYLANRLAHRNDNQQARIRDAYQIAYSRSPNDLELQSAAEFIEAEGWGQFCRVLLNTNEFLFIQ